VGITGHLIAWEGGVPDTQGLDAAIEAFATRART
jgi:hypothetical protein